MRPELRLHPAAWSATALVLAGEALRLPSAFQDAATGEYLPTFQPGLPLGHLLSAPLSAWADSITCNSALQDKVLVGWLLALWWVWRLRRRRRDPRSWPRELAGYALYLAAVLAFLGWALLAPRPASRLETADPDLLKVDFHSHTNRSWDGRHSFSPAANIAWHRRTGFDAAFVTDHNVVEGSREAKGLSGKEWRETGYRSLEGEEFSLRDAHIVVLGNRTPIDKTRYDRDLDGVYRFLGESRRYGGLPVMSLPEYWLHHRRERWEEFAERGAAGFELVNSAPKALDFPARLKREAVELCRRRNLFLAGATDNHGWGSAACVWNVLRIPGHRALDPDRLQEAVLAALKRDRFQAVRVVARVHQVPLSMPWALADPAMGLWTLLRTLTWAQAAATLAWVWGLCLLRRNKAPPPTDPRP